MINKNLLFGSYVCWVRSSHTRLHILLRNEQSWKEGKKEWNSHRCNFWSQFYKCCVSITHEGGKISNQELSAKENFLKKKSCKSVLLLMKNVVKTDAFSFLTDFLSFDWAFNHLRKKEKKFLLPLKTVHVQRKKQKIRP